MKNSISIYFDKEEGTIYCFCLNILYSVSWNNDSVFICTKNYAENDRNLESLNKIEGGYRKQFIAILLNLYLYSR